jgi:hypothetical protein
MRSPLSLRAGGDDLDPSGIRCQLVDFSGAIRERRATGTSGERQCAFFRGRRAARGMELDSDPVRRAVVRIRAEGMAR